MNIAQRMSQKLEFIRRLELCPSILNLYVERYSLKFLLNDIFAGIKIFSLLFPIVFSLAFFSGGMPVQGIISCAVVAFIGAIFGGAKYRIASVALPVCILAVDIFAKYQYKGMFYTALFVALILILFGFLKISNVLRHISHAFISALTTYVILAIIVGQLQYILGINTVQSSQEILENFSLFNENLDNITKAGVLSAAIFLLPIILLKSFFKGFFSFFAYLVIGCAISYLFSIGLIPELFEIKTVGQEMISGQSALDNIMTISWTTPSQTFLANAINYAFVIALVIGCETCFCTNVLTSMTGDNRIQTNAELIASGIANFASIACGGLFVSPNTSLSIKNIKFRAKTVIPLLVIAILCGILIYYNDTVMRFLPLYCLSGILLVYAVSELFNRQIKQYFNIKSQETYIFWITLLLSIYFGFIPATIIGFAISCVFFAERMVKIKDANVHSTRNHDSGAVEFLKNKQGFANSMDIPKAVLDKIEIIQVSNILFLNIAKIVEEALIAQGKFPRILIIYFNNVPYFDNEAFDSLKELVQIAKSHNATVMISGTNGILLDILQQKASTEKYNDAFGYIVPNFKEAIKQTVNRLS